MHNNGGPPVGFRDLMSSISRAGQIETVPRNQTVNAPIAFTFGRGGEGIPHGLRFNASRDRSLSRDGGQGGNENVEDDGQGSERGPSNPGSDDENSSPVSGKGSSKRRGKPQPPTGRSKKRSSSTPFEDSSTSSSSSSRSSSSLSTSFSSSRSSSSSPSPRSSSPSSSSSGSSRRKKGKKRKPKPGRKRKGNKKKREGKKETKAEREERKALARHKVTPPSVYDGRADLSAFDKWAYEVNNWIRLSKFTDRTAITLLVSYVSGTASVFFMDYIAGNEKKWTIRKLYEALFDYCFPVDFKDRLRARLNDSVQGKRNIRDFVRDVEKLASRFPDVNERTVIQTFWNGMHQHIRLRLIEWGISAERTPLESIVRKAMDIEHSEETYRREMKSAGSDLPERKWGRFANRTDGPRPYRPTKEDSGPGSKGRKDKFRANSVTPQPSAGPFQARGREQQGRGRKLSRAKRDQLRAAGKCFQCEETGHDQRNCPKLHTMRRPTDSAVRASNIDMARLERLSIARSDADVRMNSVLLEPEGVSSPEDDDTEAVRRAYGLCAAAWGGDECWLDPETRADSRYGIYQYSTGSGDLVEIFDRSQPGIGTLEVDASRFGDPNFSLADVHALGADTDLSCIREGGYRNRRTYKIWEWSALKWLRDTMQEQLSLESANELLSIWPAMDGYCLHLVGTDVFYGLTHAEVLGDAFNPKRILSQIHAARTIDEEDRPSIFRDSSLNRRQSIMLHAVKLMVGASQTRKRKRQTEGESSMERTTMRVKDHARKVPEPIVILAKINGHQIRALLDTGSMADFLSTTVVDQLGLQKEYYLKPLSVQLAVHGSRSKINCGARVNFQYQAINCERRFDIANLDNYDAILGTPFLFQHKVAVGINPSCVVVGSNKPVELEGPDMITISSAAADLLNDGLDKLRTELRKEAEDLCPDTSKAALPPMRAVNHTIPLIDEHKVYHFRPSKCPEAFREQWREKKNAYLATGRWRTATGHNAIPLLMIPKAPSSDGKRGLRTVFDKREQNANTYKLASPLPDIEEILREVSRHKYRSIIDGKDAYEQIRVIPEHVSRTLFTTPDGTMESLVMQQGDSNAGATYQTLMNHLFASYIGVFMYVYLDDVIIFSDSIKEHVEHIRIIFSILRKERLFLSPNKMQFFADELKILGRVIDDKGIQMDPHKVDKVVNWKTPTNKDLLRSFIGAVGFLAPDCKGIRIPMGHLSSLTADTRPWRWDDTAQRSFEGVKRIVDEHRDRRRKALDYSKGADPIYVTTDGCLTGGGGYVSQGKDPETASVVAFWSGKWNAAQQNYPVHEQELLALIETLKRFRGVLHGTKFVVRTDHKGLEYFMKQRNLSPRQHRWLDVLSEFQFEIRYIPGETNGLADALSRIYSDEPKGVTRAKSEYIDEGEEVDTKGTQKLHPVYVESYLLTMMNAVIRRSSRLVGKPTPRYKETRDRALPAKDANTGNKETGQGDEVSQTSVPALVEVEPELATERRPVPITNKLLEASSDLGVSFPDCIRNRYHEDNFFKDILANPEEFTNFVIKEELVYFRSEGIETIAIPDVQVNGQSVREILIRQGHSILAHLSDERTATYMRDQVWWKTMIGDITDYCRSCQTCAVSKPLSGKPHGKLKTMPIPTYPWQYIGVDFVGPLPESINRTGGYDMICVIIDLLTSMVHLVPSKQTYRATDIAELMFEAVYKLHGLPERIISDRDSLFTSRFWKRLHRLLGTELRMSSAFHPQTDGATERANRTVTQMIRQCVRPDQKDWVTKLPAIEFAINSARSSTTGFSPFQLNYGRNPSPMIWRGQEEFPGVRKFAGKMKMAIMSAHDSIIAARMANTVQANRKRTEAKYKVGDLAYLSTKSISLPKGRARKLAPKYLGPFTITKILKEGATYQLDLSDELIKRGINPSFHASLLKPHVPSDDRRFPGRLPSQIPGFGEKSDEWIVEAIVAHHGRGTRSEFEVLWKAGDKTWAPYREVAHLIAMDRYCELMGVEDPHDLPAVYPKHGVESAISVGAVRVGWETYKGGGDDRLDPHLPTMAQQLTHDEWLACYTFDRRLDLFLQGNLDEPLGHPPPRYPDYVRLRDQGSGIPRDDSRGVANSRDNLYGLTDSSNNPYGPAAPRDSPGSFAQSTAVCMPPESLASLLSAQVTMVKLAMGRRGGHSGYARRYGGSLRPSDHADRRRYYSRGRGAYRGGRYGRARPALSLNKQEMRALDTDTAMTDMSAHPEVMAFFNHPDPGNMPSSSSSSSVIVSAFSPEMEGIAERLANDMSNIGIGYAATDEGDVVVASNKGKGVERPGEDGI